MPRDIDQLTTGLQKAFPDLVVEFRRPGADADEDGKWFVSHPKAMTEVNVESGSGNVPFLVASDFAPPMSAKSVEDAVKLVIERLGLRIRPPR